MKAILLFYIFICGTFINDFLVFEFPAFYFLWLALIFLRLSVYPIRSVEILVQVVVFCIVLPPMVVEIFNFGIYWNYYLFIVLYVNFLFLVPYFFGVAKKRVFFASLLLLCFLALISVLFILSGERRAVIGFGPNVLYRMHGMIYAFFVVSAIYSGFRSRLLYFFVTILFLISMAATGSRGALVVVAFMALFSIFFKLVSGVKGRLLPVYFVVFSVSIFFAGEIVSRFWRLFKFDLDGDSAGARVTYFSSGIDFFVYESSWYDRILGVSSVNYLWDNYPHNFLLEALVFSGVCFFSFIVLSFLFLVVGVLRGQYRVYFFLFISSLVGAMFSGGLMNNFVVLSFLFYVMVVSVLGSKGGRGLGSGGSL